MIKQLPLAILLLTASPALAQLDHGDVALRIDQDTIQTGFVPEDSEDPLFPRRIFIAEFDSTAFTNEPGFDCEPNTFSPNSSITFDILTTLRIWNGADFLTASPSALRIRFANLEAFTPSTDPPTPTPGFSLSVAADGSWHRHLGYTLLAPAPPGVYLLSLQLRSSDPAVGPSLSFWFVMGNQADEETMLAAHTWVDQNLLNPPPPLCRADFNQDGFRNPDDLADFITCFFLDIQFPGFCPAADFNADTSRDPDDLADFITTFFLGCE